MEAYHKNRLFDVIVIGGGISGLGVALECASRGFETIVVEREKICSATSNSSLRIIHGGLRYLQHGNLIRIAESLKDQLRILKEAPSLVKLLPCVMPLRRFGLKSRGPIELAASIYNALTEQVVGARSKASIISSEFVEKHVSLLKGLAPYGALLWYDARLRDPQKFSALIRHKIDREGGEILEHTSVTKVRREQKVFVVSCNDQQSSGELCGRVVVNATGPWINEIEFNGVSRNTEKLEWCRAFNVILSKKLQERFAVGATSPKGRLFFAVPRAEVTTIGTEYLCENSNGDAAISEEEVSRFLTDFNETFLGHKISLADVREIESGILPARSVDRGRDKISLYGRSMIYDTNGFFDLVSTKYTTFHSVGNRVLRKTLKYLR